MSGASRSARAAGAAVLGASIGVTVSAGNALLLYTGQGFLRAAGLLFASTIMAIGAGVWAGSDRAEQLPPRSRARWLALASALLVAGAFSAFWIARPDARGAAIGGAAAVLLILAAPSYTAGSLLAALHARQYADGQGGGIASAALAGASFGVLLATTLLIQNLQPFSIYYAAAAVVSAVGLIESRSRPTLHGATTMQGRVVIITGVSDAGQLGFAIARAFLDAGARVIISDRSGNAEQLALELAAAGQVHAVTADLTRDDDVARLIDSAREPFGRLDALVNAAGGLTTIATIADTTPEAWRQELQRNAETALRASRAALPLLRESHGAIINFASPAGERAAGQLGAYSAAKAAVIALTRALALEEKQHGVRVNAVAPGTIDTAANRAAMPDASEFVAREDVAAVVVFLAGPKAAGISGQTIHVPGETLH